MAISAEASISAAVSARAVVALPNSQDSRSGRLRPGAGKLSTTRATPSLLAAGSVATALPWSIAFAVCGCALMPAVYVADLLDARTQACLVSGYAENARVGSCYRAAAVAATL